MASRAMIPFLIAMMLLTGVCNTLFTKYQDMQCVRDCDSDDPKLFEQPVIQTLQMFIGEAGTWLVVLVYHVWSRVQARRSGYQPLAEGSTQPPTDTSVADDQAQLNDTSAADDETTLDPNSPTNKPVLDDADKERMPLTGFKVVLLALPACFDIAGTTLMNVGLLFVAASIYQMTRGALVLFVGLFSVLFLKRRLGLSKWLALFIVVAGVALVGLAGALEKDSVLLPPDGEPAADGSLVDSLSSIHNEIRNRAIAGLKYVRDETFGAEGISDQTLAVRTVIGVCLIAAAQIFTASQFVMEESIMERYSMAPIRVVGWEGIFGLTVTIVAMVILHIAVGRTEAGKYGYFDAVEGLSEVFRIRAIGISSILTMISIGGFNFFGLSVTRQVSATSRSTIDTCRTLFIWIVSLGLGWETFKWLQVVGFALLVYGTFLFNDIVRPPLQYFANRRRRAVLLPEQPIEHN